MSALRTPEERWAADAALLASGEPLASLAELAELFGVPSAVVMRAVSAARFVVGHAPPIRYVVADVRPAIEAHLKAERQALAKRRRFVGPPPRAQRSQPEVYFILRREPSSTRLPPAQKPPKSA